MSAREILRRHVALLLAAVLAGSSAAQTAPVASPAAQAQSQPATAHTKPPSGAQRRRAARLFLEASRLYEAGRFEAALRTYDEALKLDPTNTDYRLAAEVARSHAVTALLQNAAQARARGDLAGVRAALSRALAIDPGNQAAADRLGQIGDDLAEENRERPSEAETPKLGAMEELQPSPGVHSFHSKIGTRQLIQQVFRAWGIEPSIDDSVRGNLVRFDVDEVDFAQAMKALSAVAGIFYVPIDAHRAVVARDTREQRQRYMRYGLETLSLSGLSATEMTDMANLARNVFEIQQAAVDASSGRMTLRAPESSLKAFNATYSNLMEGRGEVLIDVRVLQLAHSRERNTGAQPTQQITMFNVMAEARSIVDANKDLVQQIIAQGLASPNDYAAILGILIASGAVTNSIFSNGVVVFGGSCNIGTSGGTCSPWAFGASPGPTTVRLSLNSSDSRALDEYRMRLVDGEEGTLKSGTRYPIQTSSYSNLSSSSINIPGLTNAGNSSSLYAQYAGSLGGSTSIPQFQYQDLGLVLKTRARILRSGDVSLGVDMTVSALTGAALNDVPVLANRAFSGNIIVPGNQSVVIAGEVDKAESRAISGYPGISEIPGLNNVTNKDKQMNTSTLLVILTPHVVRMPHGSGRSPLAPVDRNVLTR